MQIIEWEFESTTGLGNIYAEVWIPASKPKAIVQIAHGMAEHIGRYAHFATFLVQNNYAVIMNDHAGHGKSIHQKEHRGYFGAMDGWRNVVQDLKILRDRAVKEFPNTPMVLMGQSMGSFLIRAYAMQYTDDHVAYILAGTAGKNPAIGLGRLVAKIERWRNGAMKESKLLQKLTTGSFNHPFTDEVGKDNWLTSVRSIVDQYEKDPLCGFAFTAEAMLDLFDVITTVTGPQWAKKVPDIPIYILSGDLDPVGVNGRGVHQVVSWLEETGHHQVSYKLYKGRRHEMLNEINRLEVYNNVLMFLDRST